MAPLFYEATRHSITVHAVFVPVFQCHALKRHRPINLAPNFINSVISQYNSEYGQ